MSMSVNESADRWGEDEECSSSWCMVWWDDQGMERGMSCPCSLPRETTKKLTMGNHSNATALELARRSSRVSMELEPGSPTRWETGNDESRRVLEGGRDTGAVHQAALGSPGGLLRLELRRQRAMRI